MNQLLVLLLSLLSASNVSAHFRESPWTALIYSFDSVSVDNSLCGAALLNPQWILTSAECRFTTGAKVILGSDKWCKERLGKRTFSYDEGHLERRVKQIVFQPGAAQDKREVRTYLALAKLDEAVPLGESIKAAKISLCSPVTGHIYSVSGWGQRSVDTQCQMHTSSVQLVDVQKCKTAWRTVAYDEFCASHTEGSRSLCEADEGDPMMDGDTVYGTAGRLNSCRQPSITSAVFVDVTLNRDWIEATIAN